MSLDQVGSNISNFLQKFVGFMQETGIIFMALLALLGLLLYLVAGNNPIIKRLGLMMGIIFGVFIFIFAYLPVLYYYYTGGGHAPADTQIDEVFDKTHNGMAGMFHVILIIGIPITVTVMLLGLLVRGLGANNPMRKRKGVGMVLISPIILFLLYIIPNILRFL
jgi:magnesium-transporting ATPase (P-type)